MTYLTKAEAQNPQIVKQLAQQILPDENIQEVKPLLGLVSHNYQINNHWIFKVASPITMPDKWEKQSNIAPLLQKKLGCHVPQIQYTQIPLSDKKSIPVCYYEQISGDCITGSQLVKQPQVYKERYFERLAELVYRLHNIPIRNFPISLQTRQKMAPELLGNTTPFQKKLLNTISTPILQTYLGHFPNQVLCHTDLHSENVCLNQQGDIVGLLDFDNLCLAPRFMEFTPYLYHSNDLKSWIQKYNRLSPQKITLQDQYFHKLLLAGYCAWATLGVLFNFYKPNEKDRRQNLSRIIQKTKRMNINDVF